LQKESADKRVSPSADGDEGSAPSTAPPFEKGGRKLSLLCLQSELCEAKCAFLLCAYMVKEKSVKGVCAFWGD